MKKLITTLLISSALTLSSAIACDDCPPESGLKIASSAEQSSSADTPAKDSLKKHKKHKKRKHKKNHEHEHHHDGDKNEPHKHEHKHEGGKNEHHEHKHDKNHSADDSESVAAPASDN